MSKRAFRLVTFLLTLVSLSGISLHGQTLPSYSQVASLNYNSEGIVYAFLYDLNGDGLTDVVGCFKNSSSFDVVAWYQNTSHQYPTATYLAAAPNGCSSLAVGDLNDDSLPDIVASSTNGLYTLLLAVSGGGFSISTGTLPCDTVEEALYIVGGLLVSPMCGTMSYTSGSFNGANSSPIGEAFPNGGFVIGPQLKSSQSYTYIQAFSSGFNDNGYNVLAGSQHVDTANSFGPGSMPDWFTYWNENERSAEAPFWACVPVEINVDGSFGCISYGESTSNTQTSNYLIYYTSYSQGFGTSSTLATLGGYSFPILPSPSKVTVTGPSGQSTGGGPPRGLFNVFPWDLGNGPNDFVVANADGNLYAALHTGIGTWSAPQTLVTIPKGQYIFDARPGGAYIPQYFLTSDALNPNPSATLFQFGNSIHVWTAPPLSVPTMTTVTSDNPSAYFGANIRFTATVADSAGSGTPTGTLTFYLDGKNMTTTPVVNGAAIFAVGGLSIGTHQMTASYTPAGPFLPSSSAPFTQTITKIPTGLNVTINPSPGIVTQNVTFSVHVSAANDSTPTGAINISADGSTIGTPNLASGTASVSTSSLGLSAHSITVSYPGTSSFDSSSTTLSEQINQMSTSTSLSVSPSNSVSYGNSVTFTATVTSPYGTPNGNVTFTAGGTSLGTVALNGSGVATVTTSSLGANNYAVIATYAGTTNFASSSANTTLTVNHAVVSLTWNNPAAITYGTALNSTQLNATATYNGVSVPGTFTYTPAAGSVLAAGTQTLDVVFTPSDTANYSPASKSVPLTVNKAAPVVTWTNPAPITYGTPVSSTQLNATANVDGFFAYSPVAGTVLHAGSQLLTVTFTPTDSNDYLNASATVLLTVNKQDPIISWTTPAPLIYGTALSSTQLNATSNIPGTIAYSPATGSAPSAGTQTLTANFTPTDTTDYNNATKTVDLEVDKATPVVTWANPASIVYGTPLGGMQLNATANVSGSFAYTPGAGAVLAAGMQTLSVTFTPTDTRDYNSVTQAAHVQVTKADPVVAWHTPDQITFGVPLSSLQLNATASGVGGVNLSGQMTYTPGSGNVLNAGTQTLTVSFVPTDTANYNNATGSVALQVNKAAPRLNWPTPAPIIYGTTLSGTQLNASAGNVKGSFAYTPGAGVVLNAGVQNLSVTFTPLDTANYSVTTAQVQLQVNKATPVLTWATPAAISYGTALANVQLNASSGSVAGSFAYTPAAGIVLNAGLQTLSTVFTPSDSADYTTATATVPLTVDMAMPTLTVASSNNPSIYNSPVTFTAIMSNGPSGTITFFDGAIAIGSSPLTSGAAVLTTSNLAVGTHSITAKWDGNANYRAVFSSPISQVVKVFQPTLTWQNPAAIVYGTPLSNVQLNATANVSGAFTYAPSLGTILSAGNHQLTVSFIPTDTTDYTVETTSVTIVVQKATPVVAWANPAPIYAGTPLDSTQLNATANIPGAMSYAPGVGAVLPVGAQSLAANFTPADTVNYNTVSSTVSLNVVSFTVSVTAQSTASSQNNMRDVIPQDSSTTQNLISISIPFGSGQPANLPVTLTPLAGFTGVINLSCDGVPQTMACNFAQEQVDISKGPVTTNLAITTQGRSVTYSAGVFLGILSLGFGFRRRVRKSLAYSVFIGLCAISLLGGLTGCAGGSFTQFDGTPKGNYILTVLARSGSIVTSTKINVTVK